MFTPFGKAVRKHRIENGVRLMDMAEYLDVKSSYLSAMETGKKAVPVKMVDKIADYLELNKKDRAELFDLATSSRSRITIPLDDVNRQRRDLATAFSRKFDELSVDEVNKLMKVLNKD